VSVEDEENRFQHNQNTHADQNHAIGLESTDSRFSFEETSTRLNLEGGAWRSQKADGSIEYMAFENMFTYKRVVREASGATSCGRHIYDQRRKNKNPSMLYSLYYRDIPQATLIHKRTDNMFIEESVFNKANVSWTREASIPSDFRCYTASYVLTEEGIGQMNREILTWMGQDIGLYAAVEMDNDGNGGMTVISELNGHNKTIIPDFYPQNNQFRKIVASYNNTFWATCFGCDGSNVLMQSNSNTPIDVGFRIGGAAALSESILFLVEEDNGRIVKYDLINNEILAETTSGSFDSEDIAISLDKKYVYGTKYDPHGIMAFNATDLSFFRFYSMPFLDQHRDFDFGGIEVTPNNMWVVMIDQDKNSQAYLASVTLHDF
jgi:hypothetical protein